MYVKYHLGKANMVVDALSRVTMGSLSHIKDDGKRELAEEVHKFAKLGIKLNKCANGGVMVL